MLLNKEPDRTFFAFTASYYTLYTGTVTAVYNFINIGLGGVALLKNTEWQSDSYLPHPLLCLWGVYKVKIT